MTSDPTPATGLAVLQPLLPWLQVLPLRTPTLPPATHINTYWVGERRGLLVDPGSPYPAEQAWLEQQVQQLEAEGRTLTAVLLTHHHPDHVGGALRLQADRDIPIVLHPLTERLLGAGPQGTPSLSQGLGQVVRVDEGDSLAAFTDAPPLTLLHTPGHAAGHLCIFESGSSTLLCGDMVASEGTILIAPGDGEGDMAAYLRQLERLRALQPALMLPAHGGPILNPVEVLSTYIEHRLMREGRVLAALRAQPRDTLTLAREVYAELPERFLFIGQLSLTSHLRKLEAEGRAVEAGDGWIRGVLS